MLRYHTIVIWSRTTSLESLLLFHAFFFLCGSSCCALRSLSLYISLGLASNLESNHRTKKSSFSFHTAGAFFLCCAPFRYRLGLSSHRSSVSLECYYRHLLKTLRFGSLLAFSLIRLSLALIRLLRNDALLELPSKRTHRLDT